MAYKHGLYGNLGDEVLANVAIAEAAAVYVGAAPLHLASATGSDYVNKPVRVSSMRDVRRYFGFTEVASEWEKYSLLQVFDRHFNSGNYNIAPIYVINVFDPETMRKSTPTSGETSFVNRVMTIKNAPNAILSTIAIDGYTNGKDFKVKYSEQSGNIVIRDLTGAGIPVGTALTYYECDPSAINSDLIIGYKDTDTDEATGLYAVKYLYSTYNVYPMWLCVPGWSNYPNVVKAMYDAATAVNGHWNAFCVTDMPLDLKPFEPVSYAQYCDTAETVAGYNKIYINLTNRDIAFTDINPYSVKFWIKSGNAWQEITTGVTFADEAEVVSASTAAYAMASTGTGTVKIFDAVDKGSCETLGYRLAYNLTVGEDTFALQLYKSDTGDFTGVDAYWDSDDCDSKEAVVAAYEAAVNAVGGGIDDLITFTDASWDSLTGTSDVTPFIDGKSAGDNFVATYAGSTAGVIRVTFSANERDLSTRRAVCDYMENSVWANEINKPNWPLVQNGDKIYNISTLYTAEALTLCAANGGIPSDTPSNMLAPGTNLYFGDYNTLPYDIEGANELNAHGIGTCVQWGGFKLWGNSTGAFMYGEEYPQRARFDQSMVMQLFLCNDFQTFFMDDIDRPLTMGMIQSMLARYQTRMDAMGSALLHARISFIADDNPTSELMEGNFVFQLDNTPVVPLNSATVTVIYTDEGFNNFFEEGE